MKVKGSSLQATSHALFPLTNPHHLFPSYTILLACLISKPLFKKIILHISIHLFCGLLIKQLPIQFPTYTLIAILSFSSLSTWLNHWRTTSILFFIPLMQEPTTLMLQLSSHSPLPHLYLIHPKHSSI